jgi:hypothetical protein
MKHSPNTPIAPSILGRAALMRGAIGLMVFTLASSHGFCASLDERPPAMVLALAKAAAATNTTGTEFNVFKVIPGRNIFDPNRFPPASPRTQERAPAPRVEAFGLVGVISYEKGQVAFFDGTGTQFRKAAKPGEKISDFTVTEITAKQVILATEDDEFEVPMGMQVRRENQGEWKLSALNKPFTSAYTPDGSGSVNSGSTASTRGGVGTRDRGARTASGGEDTSRARSGGGGDTRGTDNRGGRTRRNRGGADSSAPSDSPSASGNSLKAAASVGDDGPTTAPNANPSANAGGNDDGQSILDRLKKKREQESQTKP